MSVFLFVVFLAICFPSALSAHPHLSFTCGFGFVWDAQKLSGVNLEWTFDKFFSADIINGYDVDKNGKFSAEESNAVYNNAFIYTKNYYYFTFIRVGEKRYNPAGVKEFKASISDGSLVYRFFVDLSPYQDSDIYLAVYDYTFFCDIPYQKTKTVTFNYDNTLLTPTFTVEENKKYPIYYNPLGAIDDNTVYYAWKKGLQIYYPREIHLHYDKI